MAVPLSSTIANRSTSGSTAIPTSALVRRTGADVGIAVDPDVDRLAIVDESGTAIGEDYTLAFAVRAVLGEGGRAKRQNVVCNLSTSLVVEDAAREHGATIVRTP